MHVPDPLEYPFAQAKRSFIWRAGEVDNLPAGVDAAAITAGRHAVIAVGSNSSSTQLSRKFSGRGPTEDDQVIPVLEAEVDDVDVVYSAHLAPYGAIPATTTWSPGTTVALFVTWLTPYQLSRMNESEGLGRRYCIRPFANVRCAGLKAERALGYVSTAGPLLLDGKPVSLKSIRATHRRFPSMDQRQMWDEVAALLGAERGGDLIRLTLADEGVMRLVTDFLTAHSCKNGRPPKFPA